MTEPAPEPFLILHKVRGEPAFDIAHKLMIRDEEGWIISTSGHRAYPYYTKSLKDWVIATTPRFIVTMADADRIEHMPDNLPDHYSCNDRNAPEPATNLIRDLVNRMLPKMRRI